MWGRALQQWTTGFQGLFRAEQRGIWGYRGYQRLSGECQGRGVERSAEAKGEARGRRQRGKLLAVHLPQQMNAAQHRDGSGMCGQVIWICFGSWSLPGGGRLSQYGNGCRYIGKRHFVICKCCCRAFCGCWFGVYRVSGGGGGLFCWVCVPRTHADSFHAGQKKWTPPLGRCP